MHGTGKKGVEPFDFHIKMPSFCQDRLGTNIGKALKKEYRSPHRECERNGRAAVRDGDRRHHLVVLPELRRWSTSDTSERRAAHCHSQRQQESKVAPRGDAAAGGADNPRLRRECDRAWAHHAADRAGAPTRRGHRAGRKAVRRVHGGGKPPPRAIDRLAHTLPREPAGALAAAPNIIDIDVMGTAADRCQRSSIPIVENGSIRNVKIMGSAGQCNRAPSGNDHPSDLSSLPLVGLCRRNGFCAQPCLSRHDTSHAHRGASGQPVAPAADPAPAAGVD